MKFPTSIASLVVVATLVAGNALAERKYGLAGCGLGSIVMGKDGGQISAATTNGTSYSQVGGITSGTSNCEPEDGERINISQQQFIGKNLAALSKEAAQGNGETLVAFSRSLGCSQEATGEFANQMQQSYEAIFAEPGAVAVLESVKAHARKNGVLSQSCAHIG